MTNGLIIGGMLSLKFLFGATGNSILAMLTFVVSILVVVGLYYFAVRYRDHTNEGFITYSQSFRYIFRTYVYGSVVSSLVILLYTSLIAPGYLETLTNEMLKMYDSFNINIDDTIIETIGLLYRPAPFALINLLSSVIGAAFWGLILSAFVKKEKSIFE